MPPQKYVSLWLETHTTLCLLPETLQTTALPSSPLYLGPSALAPACYTWLPVLSPEFTGRRAQIISHDHAHHLECSDC